MIVHRYNCQCHLLAYYQYHDTRYVGELLGEFRGSWAAQFKKLAEQKKKRGLNNSKIGQNSSKIELNSSKMYPQE